MDPSLNFIKYYNSFSSTKHNYITTEKYTNDKVITLKPSYKLTATKLEETNKKVPEVNVNKLNNDANGDICQKFNLVICNDINNFIIQCIIGLSCSSKNFVVRCNDTVSNINAQILYLLSLSFHHISIINPISINVNNNDKYII